MRKAAIRGQDGLFGHFSCNNLVEVEQSEYVQTQSGRDMLDLQMLGTDKNMAFKDAQLRILVHSVSPCSSYLVGLPHRAWTSEEVS